MECILCGSSSSLAAVELKGMAAARCAKCGTEALSPRSEEDIRGQYGASYYDSWGAGSAESDETARLKRLTAKRYLAKLAPPVPGTRLLDVGCAFGYLLDVARALGYDAYGVELSPHSSMLAQRRFGDRITTGTLRDAAYPNDFFDVIALMDVLEHVSDPVALMREVARIIKPGGRVLMTTPNNRSFSRALLGRRQWFHYKSEHLIYLNPRALAILAEKTGFHVIRRGLAVKRISLAYLSHQFSVFKTPFLTPLMRVAAKLPSRMSEYPLPLAGGEMFAILERI